MAVSLLRQSRIGPPKTMCYQTQRYAMYADSQLVFETSQVPSLFSCTFCTSQSACFGKAEGHSAASRRQR